MPAAGGAYATLPYPNPTKSASKCVFALGGDRAHPDQTQVIRKRVPPLSSSPLGSDRPYPDQTQVTRRVNPASEFLDDVRILSVSKYKDVINSKVRSFAMLHSEEFVKLIQNHWSDSAQIAGVSNIRNIVDDVLAGYEEKMFKVPEGGHHIEIFSDLAVIVAAAQFLLSLTEFITDLVKEKKEEKDTESVRKVAEIFARQKEKQFSEEEIRQIVCEIIQSVEHKE